MMNVRFLLLATIVAAFLTGEQSAMAQKAQGGGEAMSLRVYQLADLILPLPSHSYRPQDMPSMPAGTSANAGASGVLGGLGGGGLGGGGLGGAGGAAFNVQFGGGGIGGGQGGGGFGNAGGGFAPGLGSAAPARGAPFDEAAVMAMDEIVDLITASIEPTSWDQVGGQGSIGTYRSMLIVNQTDKVHAKIDAFLTILRQNTGSLRTVTVAAHWLLLDSDQLGRLQVKRDGRTSIDREELAKRTRDAQSYRGQITCFSGQTVHLVGGRRRNVVTGVIPVVGGGTPAYQPRGGLPNLGVLLQVRPTLVGDDDAAVLGAEVGARGARAAIVDLQSWVTRSPDKDEQLEFQASQPERAAANGEEGKTVDKNAGTNVRVDRLDIASQSLATTLRAPIGVPVLAGGLTAVPQIEGESGEAKQLYLVVEVNVMDDAPPAAKRQQPKGF